METTDSGRAAWHARILGRIAALALFGAAAYMFAVRYQECWVEPPFEVDFMPKVTNIILTFWNLAYKADEFSLFLLCALGGACFLLNVGLKRSLLICLTTTAVIVIVCSLALNSPNVWGAFFININ